MNESYYCIRRCKSALISRYYATDVWLLNRFRRQALVVTSHRGEFHHNYAARASQWRRRAVVLITRLLQRLRARRISPHHRWWRIRLIVTCTVTPIISAGRFAARRPALQSSGVARIFNSGGASNVIGISSHKSGWGLGSGERVLRFALFYGEFRAKWHIWRQEHRYNVIWQNYSIVCGLDYYKGALHSQTVLSLQTLIKILGIVYIGGGPNVKYCKSISWCNYLIRLIRFFVLIFTLLRLNYRKITITITITTGFLMCHLQLRSVVHYMFTRRVQSLTAFKKKSL